MKKKIWHKATAGILSAIFLINSTGCSNSQISLLTAEEKINISFSWWGTDARHDYTMAAVKAFEELHPEIDVHLQYAEFAGYDKKTAIQMASHTEADVMQINYSWVNKFSPDGNGYLDLETIQDILSLDSYDKEQLSYGKSSGVLNALPIALNAKICLYNKDLYEGFGLNLPESWDDLFAAADVMKEQGIYPLDLDQTCAFMFAVAYVEQKTGKAFITENNSLNFSEEDVQEMLQFYMELVERKVVPYVGERDDNNYKNGITAGVVQWIMNASTVESDLKSIQGQTTVVRKNPVMDGAKRQGWYLKPATMYAASKHTSHPKETALFLDFLVNGEEMAKLQGLEKGIPSNEKARTVLEKEKILTGIQVEAESVMQEMGAELMSPYFEDAALQEAFVKATSVMKYDGVSLEEAAKSAYEGMKADLG